MRWHPLAQDCYLALRGKSKLCPLSVGVVLVCDLRLYLAGMPNVTQVIRFLSNVKKLVSGEYSKYVDLDQSFSRQCSATFAMI